MFLLQAVSLENNRFTGPVHTLVRAQRRVVCGVWFTGPVHTLVRAQRCVVCGVWFTGPVHTLVRALARSHPSLRVIYLLLLSPLRPTNAQSKLNWIRYAGVWPHVQAVCVTVWP